MWSCVDGQCFLQPETNQYLLLRIVLVFCSSLSYLMKQYNGYTRTAEFTVIVLLVD